MTSHDVVIRRGLIVDGSGAPAYEGDVAIDGDTITAVGAVEGAGRREIDAKGCIVTPGFIDAHTHLDAQIAWDPMLTPVSRHGVTTALLGNCGVTFAPCHSGDREILADMMENVEDIPRRAILEGLPWDWTSYGEYLDSLEAMGPAINVAGLVGHCAVRMYVMGERSVEEPATEADIEAMVAVVRQSLRDGAVGFSTSRLLIHKMPDGRCVPGTFATPEELERIAAVVGAEGGLMQNVPNAAAQQSELELIAREARASGGPVLFSTGSNIAQGRDAIVVDGLAKMRAEGLDVTAMIIPRPGGRVTGLQCVPNLWRTPMWLALWEKPFEDRVAAINDPGFTKALIAETRAAQPYGVLAAAFWLGDGARPNYAAGPESKLCAMAEAAGEHPVETFLRLTRASGGRALFSVRTLNPDLPALEDMLTHDAILPGLGDAGAHVSISMDGSWSTTVLSHWVRDTGLFSLEEGVRRMTSAPARLMGLKDRGVLKAGLRADVNVIDLGRLAEDMPVIANDFPFGAPRFTQRATGYWATICNGAIILEDDELTGVRSGRVLRKQPAPV